MYDHLGQDITTIHFGFEMLHSLRANYIEAKTLTLQSLSSPLPSWRRDHSFLARRQGGGNLAGIMTRHFVTM